MYEAKKKIGKKNLVIKIKTWFKTASSKKKFTQFFKLSKKIFNAPNGTLGEKV